MILKLGMKHQGEQLYKVYVNQDPGMMTYFMQSFRIIGLLVLEEIFKGFCYS